MSDVSLGPISFNPCSGICNTDGTEGGLKGRFCSNWRMIPGIITLAASIVAVVCAVMWNYPYLCIPFGAGVSGSTYFIYLGYSFKYLQSLEESTHKLEEELEAVRKENETYKARNEEHQAKLEEFGTKIEELEAVKTEMQKHNATHAATLGQLVESLRTIQGSVQDDHTTFGENLETLTTTLEALNSIQETIKTAGDETTKSVTEALQETAQTLSGILKGVEEWKNSEATLRDQISSLQTVNKMKEDASFTLQQTTEETQKLEAQVASMQRELESLEQTKESLNTGVSALTKQVEKLSRMELSDPTKQEEMLRELKAIRTALKGTPLDKENRENR